MNVFQTCSDIVDAVPLSASQRLYLKPIARFNISVQLPQTKRPGKTISNWEVMEKMKSMIKPEEFTVLKVSKSTLEFIRFECEIENKSQLSNVIVRLDGRTIKLAGFPELLKLRAAEAKIPYPTRHTWDSYFRDAKNMNEMKPGERPDTIHISNLPCKWFASKQDRKETKDVPSEYILKKVFEIFGDVRCVDIPISDPYRSQMKSNISGIKTFSFGQELSFEGYVQFKEYVCFVKAMDALRGMKLLYKEGDKAFTASIKVDFDRTKHMSDVSIRRRRIEREKLMGKERDLEEKLRREQEEEERRREEDRLRKLEEKQERVNRRKSREEKRKCNQLKKLRDVAAQEMNEKIAIEERKLLIAQRKLESIRLLDELFERVKEVVKQRGTGKRDDTMTKPVPVENKEAAKLRKKEERARAKRERLQDKERQLRDKLVHKYKCAQERTMYTQREKLRFTKLRSVLADTSTTIDGVRSKNTNIDTEDSSEDTSEVTSTELNESRDTSWTEKQGFDDNNFHMGAQYKDQQWYPPNNYQSHYPHPGFYNNNPRYQYRGRGFYPRRRRFYHPFRQPYGRGRGQKPNFYDYDQEYYRYFQKFSKSDKNGDKDNDANYEKSSYHTHSYSYSSPSRSHSRHRSRSQSRHRSRTPTRSRSRHRSRTPTRSQSRHRSKTPKRSRSRHRSKTPTRSRSRHRSRTTTRSRSRHRSRSPSRSRSRHRSRTLSRSRSRHQSRTPSRSRSIQRSRTPSKPHSRHRSRTPSKSKTISHSQSRSRLRSRSHSKTSSKSHSLSRTHIEPSSLFKLQQSQTKSWSRSRSGSKSRKKTYSRSHSKVRSKSPPKVVLRSRSVSKNNMAWSDVSLESLEHSQMSHKMEIGISNHSKKPSKHKKNKKKVKKMGKHKKSKTEKVIDDN